MAPTGRHRRTETTLASLREAIASGPFRDDDMLPGERDLAERFAVSRTTLRRMLADLVAEGVLRHRQGVGTFIIRETPFLRETPNLRETPTPVAPPPEPSPMPPTRLAGLAEALRAQGVVVLSRLIERVRVLPTPDEAMMLACSPHEPILRLTRLRLVDGLPIAVERAAVPCRFLGSPETIDGSLYAALAARGHPPVRALQRVQAVAMAADDAARLGVAPGTTGVSIRRTAHSADGLCCDFTRSTYPADRYDAMTEVRVPAPVGIDA